MFIFFAALNVRLAFTAPQDLHFRHLSCMHVLNEQYPRQSAGIERSDERFSETGREINKDIVAPKRLSQIPVVRKDCQIVRTAFHLACLQAVTGGFIAENPFRSLIGCHLGFLRRAIPGTSGQTQEWREGVGGGKGREKTFSPSRSPPPASFFCQLLLAPPPPRRV